MFMKLFFVFIVLLFLGCASMGNPKVADFNPETQVEYGKTTKAEILTMLGEPNSKTYGPDGKEGWGYTYAQYQVKPATFIPVVGIFAGGSDVSGRNLIFLFDKNGILQKQGSGESQFTGTSGRKMRRFLKEEEKPIDFQ